MKKSCQLQELTVIQLSNSKWLQPRRSSHVLAAARPFVFAQVGQGDFLRECLSVFSVNSIVDPRARLRRGLRWGGSALASTRAHGCVSRTRVCVCVCQALS